MGCRDEGWLKGEGRRAGGRRGKEGNLLAPLYPESVRYHTSGVIYEPKEKKRKCRMKIEAEKL